MVTSESVKTKHTQSAAEERRTTLTSRRVDSDVAFKDGRRDLRDTTRLPTPTSVYNDGHAVLRAQKCRVSVSPRKSTKSPFVIGHGSAPPGMGRTRSDRASLRSVRIDKKHQLQQAIKFRQMSPPVRTAPKSITAESRSKSPAATIASDYSALCAMPHVMSTVRHVRASVDLAHCTVPDSVVLNNLHNVSSVDSTTQNNTSVLAQDLEEDYDLRFKIGSDVPDSISWDARRRFQPTSRSPDDTSAFSQLPEETEDPDQGSPSSVTQSASTQKESQWKTPFWKSKPSRSRELPKTPIGRLLGLQKETSVDNQSEEALNDYQVLEGSASSNISEGYSDVDDRLLFAASRILGIPFKRRSSDSTALRQSRGTDSCSQKSTDEPSSAPASTTSGTTLSDKKKKSKVPKMVRRLGKTLAKKMSQTDTTKTVNLKNIVRGFLSLQAISVDDVVTTQQRLIDGKSSCSENSSDSGKSIDMDDIKLSNPELYSSIVETVADWCEEPTAEPDSIPDQLSCRRLDRLSARRLKAVVPAAVLQEDVSVGPDEKSEQLSTRTFSSISFRERPGGSQDLDNFEVGSELAREEAFLTDVMEGRIDTRSTSSDSPKKRDDTSALQNSRQQQQGQDQVHCPEMKRVLEAIDNLCIPTESVNVPDNNANTSMEPSYLPFTDSESEDEKEAKDSANDFLHLTSSEIESFELDGLKKVLEMQGIWIFNWDRCAEIVNLSEKWKKSAALQKYVDGASGFEISMDEGTVKCYRYPVPDKRNEKPLEHVFLDGVPPTSTSSTLNLKGTLTTVGLRTTCCFPDGSQREELAWIERDGLCVQVSTELFSGERNVSRVYLKRPLFNSLD